MAAKAPAAPAVIGTVKASSGTVTVVNASGATCTLKPGDKIYAHDIVQTGNGAVQIEMANGAKADIGRGTSLLMDPKVVNGDPKEAAKAAAEAKAEADAKVEAKAAAEADAAAAHKAAADAKAVADAAAKTASGDAKNIAAAKEAAVAAEKAAAVATEKAAAAEAAVHAADAATLSAQVASQTAADASSFFQAATAAQASVPSASLLTSAADAAAKIQAAIASGADPTQVAQASAAGQSAAADHGTHSTVGITQNTLAGDASAGFLNKAVDTGGNASSVTSNTVTTVQAEPAPSASAANAASGASAQTTQATAEAAAQAAAEAAAQAAAQEAAQAAAAQAAAQAAAAQAAVLSMIADIAETAQAAADAALKFAQAARADANLAAQAAAADVGGEHAAEALQHAKAAADAAAAAEGKATYAQAAADAAAQATTISAAQASAEAAQGAASDAAGLLAVPHDAAIAATNDLNADLAAAIEAAQQAAETAAAKSAESAEAARQAAQIAEYVNGIDGALDSQAVADASASATAAAQAADDAAKAAQAAAEAVTAARSATTAEAANQAVTAAAEATAAADAAKIRADNASGDASIYATAAAESVNDAPTVVAQAASATEGGTAVVIDALAGAADADAANTRTAAAPATLSVVVPDNLPDGVSYDAATHSFMLDPSNPAFDGLAVGATTTLSITYAVSDGIATTPNTVTFTVTGTNDAPTVTVQTAPATEGGSIVTVNALAGVDDADADAVLSVVNVPDSLPAGVTYDATSHSFVLDPANAAFDDLAAGATRMVSVSYGVSDGSAVTPNTVSFTVIGTNDAPSVTAQVANVTQGSGVAPAVSDFVSDIAGNTSTIGEMAVGTFATGHMDRGGDHDWFRISLEGGKTYVFNLDGVDLPDSAQGRLGDAFLRIHNSNGNELTYNDDSGGNMNSLLYFTAPSSGTYYLNAGAYADAYVSGEYKLTARTIEQANSGYVAVPNDPTSAAHALAASTAAQAVAAHAAADAAAAQAAAARAAMASGSGSVALSDFVADLPGNTGTSGQIQVGTFATGHMDRGGDHDWFRISLEGGKTYVFNLDGIDLPDSAQGRLGDAFLRIHNSSGNELAYNDDSGGNMNSLLYFTAPSSGTYYLNAGAYADAYVSGEYKLTARTIDQANANYQATPASQDPAAWVHQLDVAAAQAAANAVAADAAAASAATAAAAVDAARGGTPVGVDALAGSADIDTGATLSVVVPSNLPAGVTYDAATHSFVLNPSNAAYTSLGAGQTATVVVNYGITDGMATTPNTVTFTVHGSNAAPTVTAQAATGMEGGSAVTVNALATAHDDNAGTMLSVVNVPASLPAGVSYDAATHSFVLDPGNAAYNHLPAGASTTVSVAYGVSDGIATTDTRVTFTVSGTNDAPTVTAVTGAATEGGSSVVVNALSTARDVDDGSVLSVVNVPSSLPAGVNYDAATHSFTLDPSNAAYDRLAAGQTASVQVTYGVSDGTATTPNTVTFTVTGTNDAPTVTALTANASEGGGGGESFAYDFNNNSLAGFTSYGTAAVGNGYVELSSLNGGTEGTGSMFLDKPLDAKNFSASFDFRTGGGSGADGLTFSFTEAPGLGGGGGGLGFSGLKGFAIEFDTWDNGGEGENHVALIQNDSGNHLVRNNNIPELETMTWNHVDVIMNQGHVTVALNGTTVMDYTIPGYNMSQAYFGFTGATGGATNHHTIDNFTISTAQGNGGLVVVDALSGAADPDAGTTLSVVPPGSLPAGVSYDAATHSFKLDPSNAAFDHLGDKQTTTVQVTYGVSDGTVTTPNTVTFTVTGTNDAPTVTAQTGIPATEGGSPVVVNALANAHDVDDGTTLSVVNVPSNLPAGVSYDAATHSFALDPSNAAYDHLAAGQTTTLSVSYGVSDGTTTTPTSVSFTVTGTNDAPTVVAKTAAAIEGGAKVSVDALSGATDVDAGTTLSVIAPSSLPAGVSYDAATHSFSLDPTNAAYESLAAGATTQVVVSYGVSDGTTITPNAVTFTVTGTAPAIPETLVSETFSSGASGWGSSINTTTSGGELGAFLGRFGGTGGNEGIFKVFDFGADNAGKQVTVAFDMYEIDSWDGNDAYNRNYEGGRTEAFQAFLNGSRVINQTMSAFEGDGADGGTHTNGNIFNGWGDEEKHRFTLETTLDSHGQLRLGFGSTLNQDISDESWGIDNVTITKDQTQLASETFIDGASGWFASNNTTTTAGELGAFLGRFGGTGGNEAISKEFSFGEANAGKHVTISFDMYEIDSWDGDNAYNRNYEGGRTEAFQTFVNGSRVINQTMVMYDGDADDGGIQTQTQANAFNGWGPEEIHRFTVDAVLDAHGKVKLGFGSTLNQDITDESWGIDNVTIKTGSDWFSTSPTVVAQSVVYGDAGNNILTGDSGNDILVGGAGIDIMTGGLGSDTFKYAAGDVTGAPDTITDFNVAPVNSGGDVLDLSDLLPSAVNENNAGGYLTFDHNANGTVTLKVDMNGPANGGAGPVAVATINMTGIATNATSADILKQLLANHELKL